MGAPRSAWLKSLGVASPWGLPGVGARPSGAGGTVLGMCGDIHPHPGPLRTTNVTSLRLHAAEEWETLLAARRVDELWEVWTWAAEESLLALSQEALTVVGGAWAGVFRRQGP